MRALLITAAFTLAGCGSTGGGTGGGGGSDAELTCDASPPTVKLATVHTDVFTPRCITGCHTPSGTGEFYGDFTTVATSNAATVNAPSKFEGTPKKLKVVEPNKPANSALWLKLLGRTVGPNMENPGVKMPNDGSTLTAAQLKTVKDWICSGATM